MPGSPQADADLDSIAVADRLARAAALWLAHRSLQGSAAMRGSRERLELAAGLMQRLADRLLLSRSQALLAGYALAVLDAGADSAMKLPAQMVNGAGNSADFAAGAEAADELMDILGETARSPDTAGRCDRRQNTA